jgi:hypothetical protein
MSEDQPGGDLDAIRRQHPDWTITAHWVTRADGPDARILRAERGTIRLSARDPADLTRQIETIRRAGL